jgi:hypothetical protein
MDMIIPPEFGALLARIPTVGEARGHQREFFSSKAAPRFAFPPECFDVTFGLL